MRRSKWIRIVPAVVVGWLLGCSGLEQLTGTPVPPGDVPGEAPAPAGDAPPAEPDEPPSGEPEEGAPPEGGAPPEEEAPEEAEPPAPTGAPVSEACGKPGLALNRSSPPRECVQDKVGKVFSYTCPPFDSKTVGLIRIYGTGPWPTNTSVCYAATYAGKLVAADGGVVKIEILPARDLYPAGEAKNRVNTAKYETRITGFTFVD